MIDEAPQGKGVGFVTNMPIGNPGELSRLAIVQASAMRVRPRLRPSARRLARSLDQFLLGDLGAEIAIVGHPVGSDDRQRDMVPDAGSGLRREKVAPGGLEEFQHRLVFKCGGKAPARP